ncbi:hypothetical protein [Tropicimonas sediminicola]|uniref:Uncharacterized protein n=1 Tax=Tropicimonas sediminicola TaxID=1031541 RepID=A0A239KPR8_9RHOB|nr:hypothetical protein [Tropicimonas sediminicola]SNT20055.1 hypothetical protein SAMN05421757_107269 [Tropicimonas sediminicola]
MTPDLLDRPASLAGLRTLIANWRMPATESPVSPGLPTSPRLRRDIGLPEIDPAPRIVTPFGERI